MATSIDQLLIAAKQGKSDAFAQIYTEYSRLVYYTALRMLGNEQDALDMVQEVMLALFDHLAELKHGKALPAYLRRMTHNRCVNLLKREGRLQYMEDTEELEAAVTSERELKTEFLPESYWLQEERRNAVLEQVAALSPEQKSVVLMFYYEELSVKEISQTLGISKTAVKTRLFRAREALAKSLSDYKNREEAFVFVPLTVLGKILTHDADASFSPEIQQGLWQSIGSEMGIAQAELAAHAALMTEEAVAVGTAAAASASGSTGLTLSLVAAGAAAILGVAIYVAAPMKPAESAPPTSTEITSPIEQGTDPSAAEPNAAPPEEPTDASAQPPTHMGLPAPELEPPDESMPPETGQDATHEATPPPEEQPKTNSHDPSRPQQGYTTSAPTLTLETARISIPVGTELTDALILDYTKPIYSAGDAAFSVEGLDVIPPDTAGEFPVYIFAIFDDARIGRAVILDIYEANPGAQESAAQDNFLEDESA